MLMKIPIIKGKDEIEVDTEQLPAEMYEEVVRQGLKVVLNRASKVTKTAYPAEAELKAAAIAAAQKNLADLYSGKTKIAGRKAAKGPGTGVVNTEAMRLARNLVKDELKRKGYKVSHIDASEITAYAKRVLEAMPDLVEQAKANIEARSKMTVGGIDITAIQLSPAKVKAAAEKAKKDKETLSATQAGKVQVRAKPKPSPQATAH